MSIVYVLTLHRRGTQPEILRCTSEKSFALDQLDRLTRDYPTGRIELTEERVKDYPRGDK